MATASLECHKRLVKESQEKKFLVEDIQKEFSTLGPESSIKHHKLKVQYNELKKILREEQFKLFLLEAYDTDTQWDKGAPCQVSDKDLKDVVRTLRSFKTRLNVSKSRIDDTAEELMITIQQFQDDTKELDQMIKELEQKRQILLDTYGSFAGLDEEATENGLSSSIGDLQTTLSALCAETGELQQQVDRSRALLEECKPQVQSARDDWQITDWCEHCCQVLQDTIGLVDRGMTSDGWTVDICGPTGSVKAELRLTVHIGLAWNGYSKPCISHVKVASEDFPTSDIVGHAMDTNSIPYLLTELQGTWLRLYPLLAEIHELRERFAIDWNCETRRMSVMFSTSSICILKVDDGYPDRGGVTLDSATTSTINGLKMSKSNATLTEWIEHLHHHLSSTRSS